MLTLSSYLDERSAKYKQEALGRIRVAMAGSPPNCFHALMEDIFGYKEVEESVVTSSGTAVATPLAPPASVTPVNVIASALLPKNPVAYQTTPSGGSGSEVSSGPKGPNATGTPYSSCAKCILPSSDQRRWSRTGLADEYNPILTDEVYRCPFPQCLFQPRQNIDTVCAHIRRHLNISIQCHHCHKLYWGSEGWLKHTRDVHKGLAPVPADYGREQPAVPRDLIKEAALAHDIATEEEIRGATAVGTLHAEDFDIEPEHRMETVTEESSDAQVIEDTEEDDD